MMHSKSLLAKTVRLLVSLAFFSNIAISPYALAASSDLSLPPPQKMLHLSAPYTPVILNGINLHPDDPFVFDFIVDKGDAPLEQDVFQQKGLKLIRYFLAALTIDEKDLWVNLSPYEKDRILPANFAKTEMGRDMLAQDYLLKQLTASLTCPEDKTGQEFWDRITQKTYEKFGTTDIPANAFSKVWIIPDQAVLYEKASAAFIVKSHLKVLMEKDLVAMEKARSGTGAIPWTSNPKASAQVDNISSDIIQDIIIPEIEKEVNEGNTFANLRQIYHAVILASWYNREAQKRNPVQDLPQPRKNRRTRAAG